MTGDIGPSGFQPFFRQLLSEFEQFPRGHARFRTGLEGAQLGDDLFPDGDLDGGPWVFANRFHESREPLTSFADREFHDVKCTRAYKMSQPAMDLGYQNGKNEMT